MNLDPEKYRSNLLKNLELSPDDFDSLIYLGALEFEYFYEHEKAIDYLEKAIQLSSNSVKAKFWLGLCLYHDYCEYSKSEKIITEALEIDPSNPACLSLLASIYRATDRSSAKAYEFIQKAILTAPDWPALRYQQAGILIHLDKLKEAEDVIHNALKITPFLDKSTVANEVDRYYENVVTGRLWNNMQKEFEPLVQLINKKRLNNI
jgi:tetratricopeptide (TPR) repeat protein